MDEGSVTEGERIQIQQIRELEFEELEIEEVENHEDSDDDFSRPIDHHGFRTTGVSNEVTFDTCLSSLHTYLGEVEDTHGRLVFLESGVRLSVPLLYLEGVVLFPEATLPLRVIQPNLINAVRKALDQVAAPNTIGVVHAYQNAQNGNYGFSPIGTTAEIQQYRVLEDGSLNVVARGRQRFKIRRRWIDVELTTFGEVQIIQEDFPLRSPRDAFGKLPPPSNLRGHIGIHASEDDDIDSEAISEDSFESKLTPSEMTIHQSAINSRYGYDITDESTSSDEDKFVFESELRYGRSNLDYSGGPSSSDSEKRGKHPGLNLSEGFVSKRKSFKGERWTKSGMVGKLNRSQGVPRAFWPYWVYRMYDSYCLAERAADMWKKIVGAPTMDGLVKRPDLLSFYIASKIPSSESTRQELLEVNGISYRLRREIELLENFDRVRCKNCQTLIARRSDVLVMSNEGPLGAYVNPHGYVHEIMTVYKATGVALMGRPSEEYSWFPGYSWTIAICSTCESQTGWLFTAVKSNLKPRSFWGIRSCQLANDTR